MTTSNQIIRFASREYRIAILIPTVPLVVALIAVAFPGTLRGMPAQGVLLLLNGTSALLMSGSSAYIALSALRRGYVLNGKVLIERRIQRTAFLMHVVMYAILATMLLLVVAVVGISRL
jgi:hypothetical protein